MNATSMRIEFNPEFAPAPPPETLTIEQHAKNIVMMAFARNVANRHESWDDSVHFAAGDYEESLSESACHAAWQAQEIIKADLRLAHAQTARALTAKYLRII